MGAAPAALPLDEESNQLLWRINHIEHYARFRANLGTTPRRVAIIGAGPGGLAAALMLAAAVFGDATKVSFKPLTAKERFTALQSGEVDLLFANAGTGKFVPTFG